MWNASSIVSNFELNYKTLGDAITIESVSSLEDAKNNDLTFCSFEGDAAISKISKSDAGIILCKKSLDGNIVPKSGQQLIFVNNPRLVFVQFTNEHFNHQFQPKISSSAQISSKAKIGKNCSIGDFVVIEDDCTIGDNSIIFPNVFLSHCKIGQNCIIQSGTAIGFDGFSYERKPDQSLIKFPHFKGVIIGDNVEINCNCSIARGSLNDTTIDDGTKIDALVHVGHNARIGKNCLLVAGTIVGGSSKIGDNCWMGENCNILDRIHVGHNVIAGAGATITKHISDNKVVVGTPAKSIKSNLNEIDLYRMGGQH